MVEWERVCPLVVIETRPKRERKQTDQQQKKKENGGEMKEKGVKKDDLKKKKLMCNISSDKTKKYMFMIYQKDRTN